MQIYHEQPTNFVKWFNKYIETNRVVLPNVPQSFWDGRTQERGNAQGGHVEATPNFREILGGTGGRPSHKI